MDAWSIAADLAVAGFPVFPCDVNKKPLTAHGFKDATVDLKQIDTWCEKYPDALVAVPTGALSGLLVIDIDPAGFTWYGEKSAGLPCGRIHKTRRDGWHLLYRWPDGAVIRNSASRIAAGIDVRGEGGYIIWWAAHGLDAVGDLADIGPAPAWLIHSLTKPANQHEHAGIPAPLSSVEGQIVEGGRNSFLTSEAGKLRRLGNSENVLLAALMAINAEKCRPPLADREVQTIAQSVAQYPAVQQEIRIVEHCRPMDWTTLATQTPPEREWFIDHWLSPHPTLLAGGGGTGKTTLAQTIATGLVVGGDYFIDEITRPLKVLCWFCEDDENEIWRKQLMICQHFNIPLADLANKLVIMPRQGHDNTLFAPVFGQAMWTPVFHQLVEQLNDYQADVLFLDNIGQTFGANENSRHDATAFVNGIHGAVRGRSFAPVFLGHPARSQGSEFAGSGAWENAMRMRWYLGPTLPNVRVDNEDVADESVRYLCKRKANYSEKDYRKFVFTNGLLLPEVTGQKPMAAAYSDEIADRVVLKGFEQLLRTGVSTTNAKNSNDYLPKQIKALHLNQGLTENDMARALGRLMRDGHLMRGEIGKHSNRTPRYGLVKP